MKNIKLLKTFSPTYLFSFKISFITLFKLIGLYENSFCLKNFFYFQQLLNIINKLIINFI